MALTSTLTMDNGVAKITLVGELDASVAGKFKETIEQAAAQNPKRLVLFLEGLDFMASAGLRVLVFAKQKMRSDVPIYIIGCQPPVLSSLEMSGFQKSVYLQDSYTDE
jgi:anti-anti-sigma factor